MKRFLQHFEEIAGCVILGGMMIMNFVQLLLRYLFNAPFMQVEELARYCMIWITFIGASYCAKTHTHVEVSIFFDLIPSGAVKKIVQIFVNLLVVGSFLFLMAETVKFVDMQMTVTAPTMSWLPLGVVYGVFPIGIGVMCLRYIFEAIQLMRGKDVYEQTLEEKGAN